MCRSFFMFEGKNAFHKHIKALKKTKIIIIEFQLNDMYLNYNPKKIDDFLINNNFTLVAALKFPFMLYEDRIYINKKY